MSEGVNAESVRGESGGGLQVGVLDAVLLTGLVVVVVAFLLRLKRKKQEDQNNLRNLKVVTK